MWNSQTVTLKSQNLSSNTGNVFETPKKFCVIHNIFSEVCKNFILNAQNNLRTKTHFIKYNTGEIQQVFRKIHKMSPEIQKSFFEITKVYKWDTQIVSLNAQNLSIFVPRPVIFSPWCCYVRVLQGRYVNRGNSLNEIPQFLLNLQDNDCAFS